MEDLCTSCLCAGRKLYILSETGVGHLYSQIINEIPIYMSDLHIRICWECKAVFRKIGKFKEQVKKCYMEMLQYVQQNTRPYPNYSHLRICHAVATTYPQGELTVKEEIKEECFIEDELPYNDDDVLASSDVMPANKDEIPANNNIISVNGGEMPANIVEVPINSEVFELKNKDCEVETLEQDNEIKGRKRKKSHYTHIKGKRKIKLAIKKQIGIKKKVKLKDKSSKTTLTNVLASRKVESLTDSEVLECSNTEQNRTDDEVRLEDEETIDDLDNDEDYVDIKDKTCKNRINKNLPERVNSPLPEKPTCADCGKTFSSWKTYRYHRNVLHKGQNRHPCPRCGRVYQWSSNLGRHMRSHKAKDSGELYCEKCDKRFASVATYRQHLRISKQHVSESEFSFMCTECGKKFVSKTRLRDHVDWDHLKKIKFKCQICNKAFKCHTSLYVHTQNVHRTKTEKGNLCHVCGKSYPNAAKLKYHIVAAHTTETPYQCQQCPSAFGWYSSLYRHVKEVHYKLKTQPNKNKKQKKTEVLSSLIPALPVLHHSGHV